MPQDEPVSGPGGGAGHPADTRSQRARSIADRIMGAVENLLELQVVTVVGGPEIGGAPNIIDLKDRIPSLSVRPDMVIATMIDLVDGDIRSFIPQDYFSDENAELRKFHGENVKMAQDIVAKNITALVDAAERLRKLAGD